MLRTVPLLFNLLHFLFTTRSEAAFFLFFVPVAAPAPPPALHLRHRRRRHPLLFSRCSLQTQTRNPHRVLDQAQLCTLQTTLVSNAMPIWPGRSVDRIPPAARCPEDNGARRPVGVRHVRSNKCGDVEYVRGNDVGEVVAGKREREVGREAEKENIYICLPSPVP